MSVILVPPTSPPLYIIPFLLSLSYLLLHLLPKHLHHLQKTKPSSLEQRYGSSVATKGPSYPLHPYFLGLNFLISQARNVLSHRFASSLLENFQRYGTTYSTRIARKPIILTIDPLNLETVMKSRFGDYTIIPARRKMILTLFGEGIFAAGAGKEWAFSRGMVRACMRELALDIGIYERGVEKMVDEIRESYTNRDEKGIDFRDVAGRYTLGVSSALIIGDEDGEGEGEEMQRFQDAFAFLAQISGPLTIFNNQVPFLAYLLYGRRFAQAKQLVYDVVDKYAARERQRRRASLENKGTWKGMEKDGGRERARSVVEALARQVPELDVERIRSEALNLLLAGHATVGASLSELFWFLARYPDVWKGLREEVAVFAERAPALAELKGLRYLRYVINEVLRLRPTLSAHARVAAADTVLPRGGGADGSGALFVGKGTYVVYSNYALHRDPHVFGEDVEELQPERWEDVNPARFEYLDFGAGPRSCPGKEMGWTILAYATVRLAQEFEQIEAVDHQQPWEEARSFAFYNRHGVKVKMAPAARS